MRKSTASSVRSSHAGSLTSQHSNSQAQAKLLEKKKEFELLQTLERMAAEHARRLDAIHTDCDVMADAGRGMTPYYTQRSLLLTIYVLTSVWRCTITMAGDVPYS